MSSNTQKINAVFESDLEKILQDLNLHQAILNGEIKCFFCREVITMANLEYIFPQDGKIVVSCGKLECKKRINNNTVNANKF